MTQSDISTLPATPPAQPSVKAWTARPRWTNWHTLGLLGLVVGVIALGLFVPQSGRLWSWLGTMLLLAAFAVVAGDGVVGRWAGLLIDDRNCMSLSRMQMILWTIIILSAFLTAGLSNVAALAKGFSPGAGHGPLDITIPTQLWVAMGITTTALIGSPLIRNSQMNRTGRAAPILPAAAAAGASLPLAPAPAEAAPEVPKPVTPLGRTLDLLAQQGVPTEELSVQGQVLVWNAPEYAGWGDLFRGELASNGAVLDLGKVQMFYFTLILLVAYGVAIGAKFVVAGQQWIDALPAFDAGMAVLLALSNGGYLLNKAIM